MSRRLTLKKKKDKSGMLKPYSRKKTYLALLSFYRKACGFQIPQPKHWK